MKYEKPELGVFSSTKLIQGGKGENLPVDNQIPDPKPTNAAYQADE